MATSTINMQLVFVCLLVFLPLVQVAKKKNDLLLRVDEIKEWKKITRTKTNVLVVFTISEKAVASKKDLYNEVAEITKGLATICIINCGEDKKLCKKLKASPEPLELKHYKDGSFNKNYDRKETVKSMVSFLRDPTGDLPWEEDATAEDVVHIETKKSLDTLIRKEKKPILIMFYAPWCGYCKKLKPDYSAAATELKGHSVMAGMDVDKPETMDVRMEFNITGFPTILYFENGKLKYKYGGENNKDSLVAWMKNPTQPKEAEKEAEWSDGDNDVIHLKEDTFDDFIKENPSVLVMFYAPWCGHCKKMKPEYEKVATQLKETDVDGYVAAVDATQAKTLGDRYKVKGFPTVKYFKNGELSWDFNERTADKILEFMMDPKEPPPPPPPEPEWSETPSEVVHLGDDNFKTFLKKKKHALVMFYAPWCGHCKKAKPEFMQAAEKYKDDNKVNFAAMDCTKHSQTCLEHDVTGYPTFKYFNYGKNDQKYAGGREEADFINFMKDPTNPLSSMPPAPPSPEENWSDAVGHENIHHLTTSNFDNFVGEHDSVLVMFYAPWCGHCKSMKPAYAEAATKLLTENINGKLAAVDATIEPSLSSKYEVKGFPTLKYFKNGKEDVEYNLGRKTEDIIGFMKNPVLLPPPPPEPKWSDEISNINHLDDKSFDTFISDKAGVLVMFYAPWCGHCKQAKPAYSKAGNAFLDSTDKFLAAVDCTVATDICKTHAISGFPSFKFFSNGKFSKDYSGGRTTEDFVSYVQNEMSPEGSKKEEL